MAPSGQSVGGSFPRARLEPSSPSSFPSSRFPRLSFCLCPFSVYSVCVFHSTQQVSLIRSRADRPRRTAGCDFHNALCGGTFDFSTAQLHRPTEGVWGTSVIVGGGSSHASPHVTLAHAHLRLPSRLGHGEFDRSPRRRI